MQIGRHHQGHIGAIESHFDLEVRGSGLRGLTLQNAVSAIENEFRHIPKTVRPDVKSEVPVEIRVRVPVFPRLRGPLELEQCYSTLK